MAKVKMMSSTNVDVLENNINEFIQDKILIDIKYRLHVGSYANGYYAMIIYSERSEVNRDEKRY